MKNWESGSKKAIGTAYVVIREEKDVNELGNNVPSLVPYDCSSSEDEDEQTSKQYSQHDVNSNDEGTGDTNSASPKSDSSGVSKEYNEWRPCSDDFNYFIEEPEDNISDQKFNCDRYFDRVYEEEKTGCTCSAPISPEVFCIWVTDKSCDESYCIDLLKKYGCESCYICCPYGGCFCAKLQREQLRKVQGDSRICYILPADCLCNC